MMNLMNFVDMLIHMREIMGPKDKEIFEVVNYYDLYK